MNIFLSVKILVEMKNEGLAKTKCEVKKLNPHVGNNPEINAQFNLYDHLYQGVKVPS